MRGGGGSFLDVLFRYIFETDLHLFIRFQRNLGPSRTLTIFGIVLFVILVNSFWLWTNVRKVSVLDVVGVLGLSLYPV